jgi:hypothetical protein
MTQTSTPADRDQIPGLSLDCALPRQVVQDRLAASPLLAPIEEARRREVGA